MMLDYYCLFCHKSLVNEGDIFENLYPNDVLCHKCRSNLTIWKKTLQLNELKVESLYLYNGLFRDMLIQYKQYYDEALYPSFLYPYLKRLKQKYHDYYLACIPSSKERDSERGYNHVKQIFSLLNLPFVDLFYKNKDIEQKKQNYKERHNINKTICLNEKVDIANKKILLVDDIVTTGSSMLAAYQLIKNKAKEINAFTLSYNVRYLSLIERMLIKILY